MSSSPDDDTRAIGIIDDWRITVRGEVEDIGGWRDADPSDRFHEFWRSRKYDDHAIPKTTMPHGLFRQTGRLVHLITSRYPNLDPKPIQDVYAAISAWHEDHNASRIPPQPILCSTMEQALMILETIDLDIETRRSHEDAKPDTSRETTPANDQAPMSPAELAKAFHVPLHALRQRLSRWRRKNHDGWIEDADAGPREPKYLYRICAIRPLIEKMVASSERAAKKI